MTSSTLRMSKVARAVRALRDDLVDDSGPRISTLRGYPFAILVYDPEEEWEMRCEVQQLTGELQQQGWLLHTVSMQELMLDKLHEFFTAEELEDLVTMEREYAEYDGPLVGLEYIEEAVFDALHGPTGIAESLAAEIQQLAEDEERRARTVVLVGELGTLYPFSRTSALLKFLDGRTAGVPVVFLYPGSQEDGGLKFLGEGSPDRDYRPRIYTHESLAI